MEILDRAGITEGELVGTDAHDGAVFLVEGREPNVAESGGGVVEIDPFCEGGEAGAGKGAQGVEREAVSGYA